MADIDVDELASLCIERLQTEGEQALDEICDEHPEHAVRIRGMVRQLLKLGLVEDPVPEIPESFGDYRILERIGGGGMGVVYLSEQKGLGRRVALKLIRSGVLARGKARERFAREIEAISKLDHPGICTVYEAGEVEGVPYLAMRYIEGESLASVLAARKEKASGGETTSGSQEMASALVLIEKVARALHVAHEAGLLHRDVKPANIMIDRDGEPVILDFGLARLEDPSDDGDALALTASGEQLGTPAYMAPEQVSGAPVDRRTDVYALGVTLYEALTSHAPFEARSRESLYRMILTEDPPDAHRRNRSVGRELRIVLARALAKDPAHRFATALELAEELRRIRVHEPIRTRRPSVAVRILRWSQRNRMASTVLLMAVLGLAVSLYFLNEQSKAEVRLTALVRVLSAAEVLRENPELAFGTLREALDQDNSNLVIAPIQDVMFRLKSCTELTPPGEGSFHRVMYSPDGRYVLVLGLMPSCPSTLIDLERSKREVLPPAYSALFTKNNELLVLGTPRGEIGVYSMEAHRRAASGTPLAPQRLLVRPGKLPATMVMSVALDSRPGNRRLLATYSGSDSWLWSLDGGSPTVLPKDDTELGWSGAFLPDGRMIASGWIWSADGQKRLIALGGSLGAELDNAYYLSVTERDRFLALTTSGRLRLFDHAGRLILARDSESSVTQMTYATFSPSGSNILVTSNDGRIEILDREGNRLEKWYWQDRRTILHGVFLPGEDRILTGNWAGKMAIWNLQGERLDSWVAHQEGIKWVAVSPNGQDIATAAFHSSRQWRNRVRQGVPMLHVPGYLGLALSPDRERILIVSDKGTLRLCDAEGQLLSHAMAPSALFHASFSPDGETAIVGGDGGAYLVRNLAPGQEMSLQPMKLRLAGKGQILAGGQILTPISQQGVYLWDRDGIRSEFVTPAQFVASSGDGRFFMTAHLGGTIQPWTQDGKRSGPPFPPVRSVVSLCPTRDMDRLLMGSMDRKAYLFDFASRKLIRTFEGHQGGVRYVSLSPDETRMATACTDGKIRVWDVATGDRLFAFRGHKRAPTVVEFLSNNRLVSVGMDGLVLWWSLDVEGLRKVVRRISWPQ